MAKKIYIEGNYFIIADPATNNIFASDFVSDTYVTKTTETGSEYIIGGDRFDSFSIEFADIQTKAGAPYADQATWETFYQENTGFNSATGGSVAGLRTNYVLVKSKSDFPSPSGGVITLADNTLYEINGAISLGTDRLVFGTNNYIMGGNPFEDIISYTGSLDMITGLNQDFVLQNITLTSASSHVLDITGGGNNKFKIESCIFNGGTAIGDIKGGFLYQIIQGCLFVGLADGLNYTGDSNDVFIFDNFFAAFTGSATLITINNTATYHTIFINRNMFESTASQTILDIALGLTLQGGGLISGNSFEGDGTFLAGIDASSIGWRIPPSSNIGLPGLLFVEPKVNADGPYSTTSITFAQTPEDTPFLGYSDYQPDGSQFAVAEKIELTHDQSGQTIAIDIYDTINAKELGFGGPSKLDVDTIIWQSGNTIRYTFNGAPDLSEAIVKDTMHVDSATNVSNNGSFIIAAVDNTAKWIEIINTSRTDATDNEASDSPAETWGGSVYYLTVTTGGVYEEIQIPRFHGVLENSNLRVRMRRVTDGGGNPAVLLDNGVIKIFNY